MKHSIKDFAPPRTKETVTRELEKVQQLLHEQKETTVTIYEAALKDDPELFNEFQQRRLQGLQATDSSAVDEALEQLKKHS